MKTAPPLGLLPLVTRSDLGSSYHFMLSTVRAIAPSSQPPHLADFDPDEGVNYLHPPGVKLLEALVLYADQVLEALWARHMDTGDINEGVHREVRRVLTVNLVLQKWLEIDRVERARPVPIAGRRGPELWDYRGAVEDLLEPVVSEPVRW